MYLIIIATIALQEIEIKTIVRFAVKPKRMIMHAMMITDIFMYLYNTASNRESLRLISAVDSALKICNAVDLTAHVYR